MSFIRVLNIKAVLKAICSQGEVLPALSIYIYLFFWLSDNWQNHYYLLRLNTQISFRVKKTSDKSNISLTNKLGG